MVKLALQTIQGRRHGFIGAFVALTFAVTLVTACGILVESGIRSRAPVERYAAAPVVVAAKSKILIELDQAGDSVESFLLPEQPRIPAALADRVVTVDGVRTVVTARTITTTVATANGTLLTGRRDEAVTGHGWSSAALAPYHLTAGRAPSDANDVVLDATLADEHDIGVGAKVRITSDRGTSNYTVVGLVALPPGRGWLGVVFVTDEVAARLSVDPSRVDALGVLLASGASSEVVADRVREAVGAEVAVLTGDDRGTAESVVTAQRNEDLTSLGGAFGGIAVVLAILAVVATLGLSVQQRSREIALLRAIGATPRQTRRLLLGEAAIVSLVAGAVGVMPGVALGSFVFGLLQERGIGAASAHLVVGAVPIVLAVGIGLVSACLAAFIAGRRATRIHPTSALGEAATEPRRLGVVRIVLGLGSLIGGALLSATAMSLQGEGAVAASFGVVAMLMIAASLLGPVLARVAVAAYGPVIAALFPASGFLAMANIRARVRRFASVSTPITLGVAFTVALIGTVTVQAKATEQESRDRMIADRVITAPGGLPGDLLNEVRAVAGVEAATSVLPTKVGVVYREVGGRAFQFLPAVAMSPRDIDKTLDLEVRAGSVASLPKDGIAVSVDRARTLSVGIGDRVSVRLGDGEPMRLRVVATYDSDLGFGEFVLPRAVVAAHVSNPMDDRILVAYGDGADPVTVDATLAKLADQTPGLSVMDRDAIQDAEIAEADAEGWVSYLMIGILLAFIVIAVANNLVMATGERAHELALFRLVGGTSRQLIRMVRWEAVAVIGFGVILGLAIATAALVPFSMAIADAALPNLPWQVLAGVVTGATVLGLGASDLPARSALRRDPLEAISGE